MADHNGWKNYETWCVNLWMSNEQGDYDYWTEIATECIQDCIDQDKPNIRESARIELEKRLKANWDEWQADFLEDAGKTCSVWADMLGAALSEVNWHSIAEHFIGDIDLWTAGWNMPGYMPDNPPAVFMDYSEALEYIREEIASVADQEATSAEDPDNFDSSEYDDADKWLKGQTGEIGITVGNYHYFIAKNAE